MILKWLLLFHVLGATIWAGGHLVLAIGFVPSALRLRDPSIILNFEKHYEKIGIPSLLIQVITGIWMALIYVPFHYWWSLETLHLRYLWIKLLLLFATLIFAIHARFFIMPKLTVDRLPALAFHIAVMTVLAVFFVITGLSFRFNYW